LIISAVCKLPNDIVSKSITLTSTLIGFLPHCIINPREQKHGVEIMFEGNFQQARLLIAGLGMMGGSFAMAASERKLFKSIEGYDITSPTIEKAIQIGAIQRGTDDLHDAISRTDIVVVATPLSSIIRICRDIGMMMDHPGLVMDLGSTKKDIVLEMEKLPQHIEAIGCHPVCGGFKPGIDYARADLFMGKTFVICPVKGKSPEAQTAAFQLAQKIGAKPCVIDAVTHDERVAVTSHLPYLLSVLLMQVATDRSQEDKEVWDLVGGGFRQVSSLSEAGKTIWKDILIMNQANMRDLIADLRTNLDQWETALFNHDEKWIGDVLANVREARIRLGDK
jgi:prephenate dehydrogenase